MGDWVSEMAAQSQTLEKRAAETLGALSKEQLNWRPDRETWSIGQQFDHLLLSNRPYIGIIEQLGATAGPAGKEYRPGFWGKFMLKAVSPDERFPAPVPKPLIPTEGPIEPLIVEEFLSLQEQFHRLVAGLKGKDLNAKFSSPFAKIVKLKLGPVNTK